MLIRDPRSAAGRWLDAQPPGTGELEGLLIELLEGLLVEVMSPQSAEHATVMSG
jgi:hypothetical protein